MFCARCCVKAFRHGLDGCRLRQHADLHGRDIEIGEYRIELRRDEIRRHIVDAG